MPSSHDANQAVHTHAFHAGNPLAEANTRIAVGLTAGMMVVEIAGGWAFNSMALLADGWHMSSHALALGLSALAYAAARRYAHDTRFAFGTWKIEVLGGYTSSILLAMVALLMVVQSVERILSPAAIAYNQAIPVACVGLLVNIACAWLLRGGHSHGHDHDEDHPGGEEHHSHDLNLRAAYYHVVADAATSLLAILALVGGKFLGAAWLDPVMGLAGSVLVGTWAFGLLRDCGRVLLDAEMHSPVVAQIREAIAGGPEPAVLRDLHVWRVGRGQYACLLAVDVQDGTSAAYFRKLLAHREDLVHVTVEVNRADAPTRPS